MLVCVLVWTKLLMASRDASRDHLMCMVDLACSGELESVAGGGTRIRVVGNGRQQCLLHIARHYLE